MMVLRQQGCYAQTYVAGTGYCYCYIFEIFHHYSVIFSKTYPSFLTVKEGSTSHPLPSLLRSKGGNRPTRCSEPLRYKVGGPSKVFAMLCGMGPPGMNYYGKATSQLQRRHCSIPSLQKSWVVS